MYLGKIVEIGDESQIYDAPDPPVHPGAAVGRAGARPDAARRTREQIVLQGDVPSPANPPSGCRFRTRCWKAQEICAAEEPPLVDHPAGGPHPSACHFAEEVDDECLATATRAPARSTSSRVGRDGGRELVRRARCAPSLDVGHRRAGGCAGFGRRTPRSPLAVRMRPRTLDELVGQDHLLARGLAAAAAGRGRPADVAAAVGAAGHRQDHHRRRSSASRPTATSSRSPRSRPASRRSGRRSTRPARRWRAAAARRCCSSTRCTGSPRRSRTRCCPGVENRWVTLVAATTENPFFTVISPLLSRSLLLTLEPLTDDDVARGARARGRRRARARRRRARSTDDALRPPRAARRRRRPPGLTYLEAAAGAATAERRRRGDRPRDGGDGRRPGRGALRPRTATSTTT